MPMTTHELEVLSAASDLDLAIFRPAHLEARVEKALERYAPHGVDALHAALHGNSVLREEFRRSIAISVTGFFRDADQFGLLEPQLERLREVKKPRIWSAGCSDGSELWTAAVLLHRLGVLSRSQLLGSDLLLENVQRARKGLDHGVLDGHVLPDYARPFFEVRDLVRDPTPPGLWDVVICRNVAIYFAPEVRELVHGKLVDALAPGGLLLLGRSERLRDATAMGVERVGPHLYRRPA